MNILVKKSNGMESVRKFIIGCLTNYCYGIKFKGLEV
jgi:hypothetical protein